MKTSLINQHKELRTQICKAIGEQKSIPDYERLYEKAKKVLNPYDGDFFELLDILYKKYNDEIRAQPSSNLYLKRYKINQLLFVMRQNITEIDSAATVYSF